MMITWLASPCRPQKLCWSLSLCLASSPKAVCSQTPATGGLGEEKSNNMAGRARVEALALLFVLPHICGTSVLATAPCLHRESVSGTYVTMLTATAPAWRLSVDVAARETEAGGGVAKG